MDGALTNQNAEITGVYCNFFKIIIITIITISLNKSPSELPKAPSTLIRINLKTEFLSRKRIKCLFSIQTIVFVSFSIFSPSSLIRINLKTKRGIGPK